MSKIIDISKRKNELLQRLKSPSNPDGYKRYLGTPLRYAGGKTLAVGHVIELLPTNIKKVVSPFWHICMLVNASDWFNRIKFSHAQKESLKIIFVRKNRAFINTPVVKVIIFPYQKRNLPHEYILSFWTLNVQKCSENVLFIEVFAYNYPIYGNPLPHH